jgi:hypothetical protein
MQMSASLWYNQGITLERFQMDMPVITVKEACAYLRVGRRSDKIVSRRVV